MKNHLRNLVKLLLFLWAVCSIAIIAFMGYSLWWERDLALYGGKSIPEQRRVVLERSGQNQRIMDHLEKIALVWPEHARYTLKCSGNERTYIEYYLAPRLSVAKGDYTLELEGERFVYDLPESRPVQLLNDSDQKKMPWGWLVSMFLVFGFSACMVRRVQSLNLSFPESAGIVLGLLYLLCLLSKIITGSVCAGFVIFTTVAVIGSVWFLIDWFRVGKCFHERIPNVNLPVMLLLGGILAGFLVSLALSVVVVPDDWDAWATWSAKAKSLLLGNSITEVTSYSHNDYPILWPSLWAYSAWLSGGWEEQWSRGWGSVIFALTVWQIASAIFRRTSNVFWALSGACLFAATPKIIVISSWSYAEPLLWLLAACFAGRLLRLSVVGSSADILMAGAFAAIAALAKNEGILLFASGLIYIVISAPRSAVRLSLLYILPFTLLCLPWMIWTRLFMDYGAQASSGLDFLDQQKVALAIERFHPALTGILRVWTDVQQWSVTLIAVLMGFFWAIVGKSSLRNKLVLLVPVLMLTGYFVIILFHICELGWIISTSWDRITVQVLVVAIPIIFAIAGEPRDNLTA